MSGNQSQFSTVERIHKWTGAVKVGAASHNVGRGDAIADAVAIEAGLNTLVNFGSHKSAFY
jgi:hypothetical protein